jgi:hypothetical protein
MASGNHGVIGALTGRVGPVTGYWRRNKNILRKSKSIVKDKATPGRLAQREKLRVCNLFTTAFTGTGFFDTSFSPYGETNSGYNRVTSAILSQAITGAYPDTQLNYEQVLISKGLLPAAQGARVAKKANNMLQFTFTDNSGIGIASPDDSIILVAYAPDVHQAIFTLHAGFRKDKKASLNVSLLKGHTVETWIGFLSADQQDASDSVWVGRVAV